MSVRTVSLISRQLFPRHRCFATAASAKPKANTPTASASSPAAASSKTLGALLNEQTSSFEHKDVIAAPHQSVRWTYLELKKHTDAFADGLADARLKPGSKLAVSLRNDVENLVTQIGAAKAGVTIVPLDPSLTLSDAIGHVKATGVEAFLYHPKVYPYEQFAGKTGLFPSMASWQAGLPWSDATIPSLRHVIHTETSYKPGQLSYRDLLVYDRQPSNLPSLKFAASSAVYEHVAPASGKLSHADLTSRAGSLGSSLGIGRDERIAVLAPLHLQSTQLLMWTALSSGGVLVFPAATASPDQADNIAKALHDEQITTVFASSAALRDLASAQSRYKFAVDRVVLADLPSSQSTEAAKSLGFKQIIELPASK